MDTKDRIRSHVQILTKALGRKARPLSDEQNLPKSGLLDSASILELILWVENEFNIDIDQTDLSMDNFGSIEQIAKYIEEHRK